MANPSAGLLMYRVCERGLEVFLAHPGGPFWKNRDAGAWTIPKGEIQANETSLAAARREFAEETGHQPQGPFMSLGSIRQKAGKVVEAWACEGNIDAAQTVSNTILISWPPRSRKQLEVPEVDRCEWFSAATAREKINEAQRELIDRLEQSL